MHRTWKSLTFLWEIWKKNNIRVVVAAVMLCILSVANVYAEEPLLQLSLGNGTQQGNVALSLEILLALTILSLAPAIILTVTSFTRIIIVFYFLRQAIGTMQMPPNQILISLAIFMTCAIMYPTGNTIYNNAMQPYFEEKISLTTAFEKAQEPLRQFMFKQTREKDIALFYSVTDMQRPESSNDVPTLILAAAFIISELKTGFMIGFMLFVPFIMIDMIVSGVLLAMGMMMLPPMSISLPFKILLFVMVDGWNLLIGSLVQTFM